MSFDFLISIRSVYFLLSEGVMFNFPSIFFTFILFGLYANHFATDTPIPKTVKSPFTDKTRFI